MQQQLEDKIEIIEKIAKAKGLKLTDSQKLHAAIQLMQYSELSNLREIDGTLDNIKGRL